MKQLLICALFFWQLAAGQSLPLKSLKINSGFGLRIHPIAGEWKIHQGIDLAARHDTVYTILDGIVETTGYDERLGLYVKIKHEATSNLFTVICPPGMYWPAIP